MSTPINDGGPAFPSVARDGNWQPRCDGMSLRQHFAGLAMAVLLAREDTFAYGRAGIAELAYQQADAMIAEGVEK